MKRFWAHFAVLSFLLLPLSAFASTGAASTVLAYCGQPSADYQTVSPVTGNVERNLIYGNTILHFQRSTAGGWSYLSAWQGHTPIFESTVSKDMPCFGAAISYVAAHPASNPAITDNQTIPDTGIRFGKAFLWLLFALAFILLITIARPTKRRLATRIMPMEARPFRRPRVTGRTFRRRTPPTTTPISLRK